MMVWLSSDVWLCIDRVLFLCNAGAMLLSCRRLLRCLAQRRCFPQMPIWGHCLS